MYVCEIKQEILARVFSTLYREKKKASIFFISSLDKLDVIYFIIIYFNFCLVRDGFLENKF